MAQNLRPIINKKAQIEIPLISFVAIILVLIFLAPILLKVVKAPLSKFGDSINSTNQKSNQAITQISTSFINWFDTLLIIIFVILLIVLIITSFLIDISPGFIILYIISVIILFILAPNVLDALTQIWTNDAYNGTGENDIVSNLPMTQFILDNFFVVMLGIVILTGVIIYARFKGTGSTSGYG